MWALCRAAECSRAVLLVLPGTTQLSAQPPRNVAFPAVVYPERQSSYAPQGVPPAIARDFQEALACAAAGHLFAAALVARRVLQATARDAIGRDGNNLAAEINAIPSARISEVLRDAAHEVRYIGNDAAHADAIDAADVDHLMVFTEQLLDALYVMPAKVAAARAKRTGPTTPPAG